MDFADLADPYAVVDDLRLTARMHIVLQNVCLILSLLFHAEFHEHQLDDALHFEEISVPVHAERELHALIRKLRERQCLRKIDIAGLVEPYRLVPPVVVRAERGQDAVQRRCTHDGEILAQRVRDLDRAAERIIFIERQLVKSFSGLEGVAVSLGESAVFRKAAKDAEDKHVELELSGRRRS